MSLHIRNGGRASTIGRDVPSGRLTRTMRAAYPRVGDGDIPFRYVRRRDEVLSAIGGFDDETDNSDIASAGAMLLMGELGNRQNPFRGKEFAAVFRLKNAKTNRWESLPEIRFRTRPTHNRVNRSLFSQLVRAARVRYRRILQAQAANAALGGVRDSDGIDTDDPTAGEGLWTDIELSIFFGPRDRRGGCSKRHEKKGVHRTNGNG